MKCFFITALVCCINSAFAQPGFGFKDATVYFKKGDSLLCQVKMEINYQDTVMYKLYEGDAERILLSKNIKNIRFPFKYIENIRLDSTEKLSTLLLRGNISLFSYAELHYGKTVDIANSGGLKFTSGTTTTHYIVKKDSVYKEIREEYFRRDIAPFIKDCPDMYRKLDTEGYYFKDMIKILKEYNACAYSE